MEKLEIFANNGGQNSSLKFEQYRSNRFCASLGSTQRHTYRQIFFKTVFLGSGNCQDKYFQWKLNIDFKIFNTFSLHNVVGYRWESKNYLLTIITFLNWEKMWSDLEQKSQVTGRNWYIYRLHGLCQIFTKISYLNKHPTFIKWVGRLLNELTVFLLNQSLVTHAKD